MKWVSMVAQHVKLLLLIPTSQIRALIQAQASLLLTHLPAEASLRAADNGTRTWAPATHWHTWMEFQAPDFSLL